MERLEEELTCAICCDIFSEPRVLPCSHTFCRPCLQALLQPWQGGFRLSCPSCRAPVAVPAAGPEALPVNFALKAVIDKWRQEEAAAAGSEAGTCGAHPRQPLNVYCLQDRRLVCGQCLTIGEHRGHPIDDLRSAYRKAREASGQLLEELRDPSRSRAFSCSERLQRHEARCRDALRSDREAVLRYFKELGDALEQQKEALLSALDELDSRISEKFDPLLQEVEKLKLEENELRELHSAVEKEESPLLFLEKLEGLRLRLQALRQKQLPEADPVEIHPRMENVLQDTWAKTEMGQVHRIRPPALHLRQCSGKRAAAAPWAALPEPSVLLLVLLALAVLLLQDLLSGTLPAPLELLCELLQRLYRDCCLYVRDRARQLCRGPALPLRLCRTILPDCSDWIESPQCAAQR